MAKPFLESLGALPVSPGRRTHRVLVLDGSLSMAYAAGDVTRFEQAKALAAQLVKDARRGDAISVVLMADPPRVVIGDPSPNHAEVLKEIEEVTLPHGGTDLVASFGAIDRCSRPRRSPRRRSSSSPTSRRRAGGGRGGGRRGPEAGPGPARGAAGRGRSSSTWARRAARTGR